MANLYSEITTLDVAESGPVAAPPGFQRRRASPRAAGPAAGGYRSAEWNRLNRSWMAPNLAGDAAIAAAWERITARARDIVRNEPWAQQTRQRICENVIGDEGFLAEADVEIDGEPDEESCAEIDGWCDRWAEKAGADGSSLVELQSLAMGECVEAGQAFLVAVQLPDPDRVVPLAYQCLEAEQLCTWLDWPMTAGSLGGAANLGPVPAGNVIRRGIELDRYGAPIAYHFWEEHPYDIRGGDTRTVRIPADRVIQLYRRLRPSQTQGITWFAAMLQALHDLSDYLGNEMIAGSIGAQFTVAIKRAFGAGSGLGLVSAGGDATDASGNPLEELGAGIIADIGKDDEVEQIESKRPNRDAGPFVKLMMHSVSAGGGMTYLGLTGDTAEASFSSARFARLLDKAFWRSLQSLFGRRVALPMRRQLVRQLVAFGRLRSVSPTQFLAQPWRWLQTRLLPRGWEEIQVREEVEAAIRRVQGGLSTLQIENANFGRNWRKIAKQRSRERDYTRDLLGLDLAVDYPGQVNGTVPDPAESAPRRADDGGQTDGP